MSLPYMAQDAIHVASQQADVIRLEAGRRLYDKHN